MVTRFCYKCHKQPSDHLPDKKLGKLDSNGSFQLINSASYDSFASRDVEGRLFDDSVPLLAIDDDEDLVCGTRRL